MNTILISTSQNIELEYDLSSVGERIVAGIIDYAIVMAYLFASILTTTLSKPSDPSLYIIIFILFLPISFYTLLSEIFMNGQTVGKKIMKIKVISLKGEQASFGQYLIRWLFRLVDVWFFSGLVAVITISVSNKGQRLGDMVAGTTLIKTKLRTTFQQTLHVSVGENNYAVNYPQVTLLKDNDIQLIKEVLINYRKTKNTMLIVEMMKKIENFTGIISQHEPEIFLQLILSDYNYLTAKE